MQTAEVAIVGGGVIGASVAYHLASRGVRDVVVLDRGAAPGEGSTGKATGGFRAQFSTAINIQLSLLSREKLLRFEDETGVDSGYRQRGYLFLARSAHAMRALAEANALQRAHGVAEARLLDADEARRLNAAIEDPQLQGGAFCPTDGFLRPLEILRGYTLAATRLGVRFAYGVTLHGVERDGDRIVRLRTSEGDLAPRIVVNAAGAWATTFGIDGVAVTPLRRNVLPTVATGVLPESMPMTIWLDDGFHLRVRDGRVLLLWPDAPADPFDASVDDAWLDSVVARAHERVPCLRDVAVDRAAAWSGLYEMSPDRHVILGLAPNLTNVYLANGSSGHGVMHSPAIGQLLAEIIIDGRATSIDTHILRPTRFAEGEPIVSSELL